MIVAWMVFGTVLLLFELHHLAFYALFGTVGSLAAAAVALVAPSAVGTQAAVAVAVALTGVVAVRPLVSQAFASHRGGHVTRGVHGGLTGQQAITLDEVAGSEHVGHVQLVGEKWLAVSGGGDRIPAGTPVLVVAVQGTTLVVWPVDEVPGAVPNGPNGKEVGGEISRDEAPDGADRTTP